MTDGVRFLLDGEVVEASDIDPTTTVLQYLRRRLRRTGTKEGCAEGDCGACTVAVGALEGDEIKYRAINACIAFLPTLDGRELVTVESLAGDEDLHPVQRAMVDCHGSQCGFCTPGFVMSLFVHYECEAAADHKTLCDAIAGNLCRCTGYGPILAAGRRMNELPRAAMPHAETAAKLKAIERTKDLALAFHCPRTGVNIRYFAPRSLAALLALKAQYPKATLVSGATDVGLWVTKQHRTLEAVIALNEVRELAQLSETGGALDIGATVTYSAAHEALARWHSDFGEVTRRLGSMQIRNSGTIGGNIANGSPIGDTMPLLIAGGATLVLRSARGAREMPLENFFLAYQKQDLQPDEIVERVRLPRLGKDVCFRAYKIAKRFDQDISALCGAFALNIAGARVQSARIAFGGMAATPKRASACEAALAGHPWTIATVETAMAALDKDFAPISDMRASAGYRRMAAKNLLNKVFLEYGGAHATRVLEAANG
ncbi:MAG: xanthine dehydrogenase small subunit [Parvularculaceae bacterium]